LDIGNQVSGVSAAAGKKTASLIEKETLKKILGGPIHGPTFHALNDTLPV
jgi:hypothetical protein